MILDDAADLAPVVQALRAAGASIGVFGGYSREDLLRLIASPRDLVAVRPPDGILIANWHPLAEIAAGGVVGVPLMRGSTQATLKGLALDLAGELVRRGHGDTPVAWSQGSQVGRIAANLLGARTRHLAAWNVDIYWFTADEALAGGRLT